MSHQQSVAEAIKAYKGGETRLVIHGACTYYRVVVAARERGCVWHRVPVWH